MVPTDIAMASRELKTEEKMKFADEKWRLNSYNCI
jgi:hypothetical protein